jgi:hypothetical protein
MRRRVWVCTVLVSLVLLGTGSPAAQRTQPHSTPTNPDATVPSQISDEDLAATRERLFKLLRMSPRLTAVVSRDPSLLGNQEYVSRSNPELAHFLQEHPEIARNPEFYLFAHVAGRGGPGMSLEQYVWPEMNRGRPDVWDRIVSDIVPFLVFVSILSALLWLLRVFVENRRWSRILKLQTEVHGKLLDRFSSSQELLTYMNTEAGKRFLEPAPISVGIEPSSQARMSLTRVLTPLQLGVVLTLVGTGFLMLRSSLQAEAQAPMLVFGTLGLMLGVGFMISAGLAYLLARRLGLLPEKSGAAETTTGIVPKEQM